MKISKISKTIKNSLSTKKFNINKEQTMSTSSNDNVCSFDECLKNAINELKNEDK